MSPFATAAAGAAAASVLVALAACAFLLLGRRLRWLGARLERLEQHAARLDDWITAAEAPPWLDGLHREMADIKARLERPASPSDVRHELAEIKALVALSPVIKGHVPHSEWALSPDALLPVLNMAAWDSVDRVVECGSGVSTIYLAALFAQRGRGHLLSIDHDSDWASRTRQLLEEHGLDDFVTIVHAPLRPLEVAGNSFLWYDVGALGVDALDRIDLLLVDGPPGGTCAMARYPALPILAPRLGENAVIVLDDANRPDERRILERWTEEFSLQASSVETRKGLAVLRRSPAVTAPTARNATGVGT